MSAPLLCTYTSGQLEKDQQLLSSVKLIKKLGNGQMGRVYKAICDNGQVIAVKIVPFCSENDSKSIQQNCREEMEFKALHEARTHLLLIHNDIIRLYKAYSRKNCIVLHMEYFEGKDLWTFLSDKTSRIQQGDVSKIMKQISGALNFMHNMGIAHGDIHMGNVLVNEKKNAKLIDFGCTVTGRLCTVEKRRDRMELKRIEQMLLSKVKNPEHDQKNFLNIWLM